MARLSSHIKNSAGAAFFSGIPFRCVASAAPIRICRELIIKVMVAISSIGRGSAHRLTVANSEPPAKFIPVISSISSRAIPFCPPCIPSINAQGSSPISIGELSFMPRMNSSRGEAVCVMLMFIYEETGRYHTQAECF